MYCIKHTYIHTYLSNRYMYFYIVSNLFDKALHRVPAYLLTELKIPSIPNCQPSKCSLFGLPFLGLTVLPTRNPHSATGRCKKGENNPSSLPGRSVRQVHHRAVPCALNAVEHPVLSHVTL